MEVQRRIFFIPIIQTRWLIAMMRRFFIIIMGGLLTKLFIKTLKQVKVWKENRSMIINAPLPVAIMNFWATDATRIAKATGKFATLPIPKTLQIFPNREIVRARRRILKFNTVHLRRN